MHEFYTEKSREELLNNLFDRYYQLNLLFRQLHDYLWDIRF